MVFGFYWNLCGEQPPVNHLQSIIPWLRACVHFYLTRVVVPGNHIQQPERMVENTLLHPQPVALDPLCGALYTNKKIDLQSILVLFHSCPFVIYVLYDGVRKRGGNISADFSLFVLLYNTKFVSHFKFDNLKNSSVDCTIHCNLSNHPRFPLRGEICHLRKKKRALCWSVSY